MICMKRLLIAAAIVFSAAALRAQTGEQSMELARKQGTAGHEDMPVIEDLRLFEFEMGFGMNLSPRWDGMKARPGTNLFFELRLNRPEPWDIALQLKMANFRHEIPGGAGRITTMNFSPSVFVDYNLRPNRRTRFFAGIGLGGNFAGNDTHIPTGPNSAFWIQDHSGAFSVTPRAGLSVFNFLRITAEYTVTAHDYSRFGVNIGIALGGSYKSPYVDRRSRGERFWEDTVPAIINSLIP